MIWECRWQPDQTFMDAYGIFQGGGAKGYAHVGALKAAEERGINFVRYGGTSAGAIIAALAAAGYHSHELLDASKPIGQRGILDIELSGLLDPNENARIERIFGRSSRLLRLNQPQPEAKPRQPRWLSSIIRIAALTTLEVGSIRLLRKQFGFISTDPVVEWLDKLLAAKLGCARPVTFADLNMRLKVVAANLTTGKIEKFGFAGDECLHVATATMASACFPFFFRPVVYGDTFIDGGLLSNLPVWLFDDERDDETAHLPTFGFRLINTLVSSPQNRPLTGLRSFGGKVFKTALAAGANLEERRIEYYHPIDLDAPVDTLSFSTARAQASSIVEEAKRCVEGYFEREIGPQDPLRMTQVLGIVANELSAHFDWTGMRVRAHVLLPDKNGRHARTIYSYGMDDSADDHLRVRTDADGAGAVFRLKEPVYLSLGSRKHPEASALKYELGARPHWVTGLYAIPIFDDLKEWSKDSPVERQAPFAAFVIDLDSDFSSIVIDRDEQDLLANAAAIVGEEIRDRSIVRAARSAIPMLGPSGWDKTSSNSFIRLAARKVRDGGDGSFGERIWKSLAAPTSFFDRKYGNARRKMIQ
eukprot:TRINITY_DN5467_c0_g1_i7.p1 TRINITY_DN5467_c0_g1~~TRINITY_DN5467_c0_g1_i7.p1  ORF type:complete len:588 (-),score=16.13 TRINITY_DN5467_c0_g1_i7:491-2254(-)